jgi:hypothetical protein
MQSSVPATRGTAAAYAPAAPRVPVADCGRWREESMTINTADLYKQINSCPGMRSYRLIVSYQTSQDIYSGNYQQLKAALAHIHDPGNVISLFGLENRGHLNALQIEVIRLFHNYVASALTLVDHTRNLSKDESVREDQRAEYQAKVDALIEAEPLTSFIQDLRNYFLHCGIPATGTELNWTKERQTIDTRAYLDLRKMKEWSRWRSKSKEFITNAGEKITLLEIVDKYTLSISRFHDWFSAWFEQIHRSELDELRKLQEQWNQGLRK